MEGARPAEASDLSVLTELARAALDELTAQRGGPELVGSCSAVAVDLGPTLSAPDTHLVTGTIDEVPVGLGLARAKGDRGTIELIYVEPEARGVGVGAAMLEVLRGWLAGRGCRAVDAVALPGNRPAKQFFETAGMVARLIVMHGELDG